MGGECYISYCEEIFLLTVSQLGVQIMEEEDQLRFGFDLFDPTKIVPEELVPVTPIGKMQLNRNPLNYFAETEQIMVCTKSPP